MKKIIKTIIVILMIVCSLNVNKNNTDIHAEETAPVGNYLTLNIGWNEGCKELVEFSGSYTLAGNRYEVKNIKTGEIVGYFVTDDNGKGINEKTGTAFIDNLPDGTYRIRMAESANSVKLEREKYKDVELKATVYLPETIEVNTLADVFGRNAYGSTTGWSSAYKFWSVAYGTGVFECAISELDPPSSIRNYGKHNISTEKSYVLDRFGKTYAGYSNELIYRIMYYTSDEAMWSGFKNVKNVPWTTRDTANYTYYSTGQTDAQKVAEFVRHVALSRAWGRDNGKWNVQQYQDGFTGFWQYVTNSSTPNAPEDYRVLVWECYQQGYQDMMYAYKLQVTDYDKANVEFNVTTGFDPIKIVLTKSGTSGEKIEDAEFTMKYYTEDFSKVDEASKYTAKRTWTFRTDEKGEFRYNNTYKVSGDEVFIDEWGNAILIPGTYTIEETKVPEGYTKADTFLIKANADLSIEPVYLDKNGNPMPRTLETGYSLTELKEGYATLNKKPIEQTTNSVAGAEYTVYTDKDCTVVAKINNTDEDAVLVTKEDGSTNTIALVPATYYVKETKAPEGFILDATVYEIEVKEETTVTVESTEEVKKMKVKVIKVDADNNEIKIEGVTIGLFDKTNDSLVEEKVTDENGEVEFTAPYGLYYVQETKAVFGYAINPDKFDVNVDWSDETTIVNEADTITIEDKAMEFTVNINKTDNYDKPVKDAVFGIFNNSNDQQLMSVVTDEDGKATVKLTFSLDKYYIKEIEAPFGYKLSPQVYVIDLPADYNFESDTYNMDINNENRDVEIVIRKLTKREPQKPLAGAVFEIYDENDTLVYTTEPTNADGYVKLVLPYSAQYYAIEKVAPFGYSLDTSKHIIEYTGELNEDGTVQCVDVIIADDGLEFCLQIYKKNYKNKLLAGAEFEVIRAYDDTVVAKVKTDENGFAEVVNLVYDVDGYYLLETKAPEGYQLSKDRYIIDESTFGAKFDFAHQNLEVTLHNEELNIPQTGDTFAQVMAVTSATSLSALITVILLKKKLVVE